MTTEPTTVADEIAAAVARVVPDSPYPIRERPVPGTPKATEFRRGCGTCRADFVALATGKTGERGLWRDWVWYCSAECDPGVDALDGTR